MSIYDKKYKPSTQEENTQAAAPAQTGAGTRSPEQIARPTGPNLEKFPTINPPAEGLKELTPVNPTGVTDPGIDWRNEKKPEANAAAGSSAGGDAGTPGTGAGAAAASNAPVYKDSYAALIKEQYDAIVNRQPFSYNAAEDPLYQQYVDKYVQHGRLAMRDSMGQAAALTGGYGSSYGQAVGQQQYNEYMRSLSDALPELYGQAYDRYEAEGDRMLQNYQMLGDLADDEYAKYRDEYSDYVYNEQVAYDRQQDAYGNLQNLIAATGMIPSAEQLAEAGMSEAEARALRMEYAKEDPKAAVRKGIITEEEYQQITGKKYKNKKSGGTTYYNPDEDPEPKTDDYTLSDVAGIVDAMINNGDRDEIDDYLREEVKAGNITEQDAAYIKKDSNIRR